MKYSIYSGGTCSVDIVTVFIKGLMNKDIVTCQHELIIGDIAIFNARSEKWVLADSNAQR